MQRGWEMRSGAASVGVSRGPDLGDLRLVRPGALDQLALYAGSGYRRNYLDHMAAIGSIPVYTPGETVEWTDTGKVLLIGWSIPHEQFRWSMGKSAGFAFRLAFEPSADLHLDMHVGPTVGEQHVEFTANDAALGSKVLTGQHDSFPVPSMVLRPGVNVIRIAFRTHVVPTIWTHGFSASL